MKFPGTHAFANQILVYTLVTLAGGGSIGLGAVWMQQQITVTAAANKALERESAKLRRALDDLNAQVDIETTPAALELRNNEWRLGLNQTPRDKVTLVAGDVRLELAAKRDAPADLLKLPAYARFSRPEDR